MHHVMFGHSLLCHRCCSRPHGWTTAATTPCAMCLSVSVTLMIAHPCGAAGAPPHNAGSSVGHACPARSCQPPNSLHNSVPGAADVAPCCTRVPMYSPVSLHSSAPAQSAAAVTPSSNPSYPCGRKQAQAQHLYVNPGSRVPDTVTSGSANPTWQNPGDSGR
jgi:hypothetical protein